MQYLNKLHYKLQGFRKDELIFQMNKNLVAVFLHVVTRLVSKFYDSLDNVNID